MNGCFFLNLHPTTAVLGNTISYDTTVVPDAILPAFPTPKRAPVFQRPILKNIWILFFFFPSLWGQILCKYILVVFRKYSGGEKCILCVSQPGPHLLVVPIPLVKKLFCLWARLFISSCDIDHVLSLLLV